MVTIKAEADECEVTKKIGFSRKLRFKKEITYAERNISTEKRQTKFSLKRFFRWKQEKPPEDIEFDSGYGESLQQIYLRTFQTKSFASLPNKERLAKRCFIDSTMACPVARRRKALNKGATFDNHEKLGGKDVSRWKFS